MQNTLDESMLLKEMSKSSNDLFQINNSPISLIAGSSFRIKLFPKSLLTLNSNLIYYKLI